MSDNAAENKAYYDFGNELFDKMLGNNDFIFVDASETAVNAFRSCLLNVGLVMHMAAVGHFQGERNKARMNREIVGDDEISKRTVAAYATYYTRTVGPLYPWMLSCVQAHLTKANVDKFEIFVNKSYAQGIKSTINK